jgi:hypothetical protein
MPLAQPNSPVGTMENSLVIHRQVQGSTGFMSPVRDDRLFLALRRFSVVPTGLRFRGEAGLPGDESPGWYPKSLRDDYNHMVVRTFDPDSLSKRHSPNGERYSLQVLQNVIPCS